MFQPIRDPADPSLDQLCSELSRQASELDQTEAWPSKQLQLCGEYGVYRWFLPAEWGGFDWNEVDVLRGYLKLSAACLTTTFILTQRSGACQRIVINDNDAAKQRWLLDLASGVKFGTVGISHLTTSRRHLARPAMQVSLSNGGFVFNGYSPWVTGARHADVIVLGGTLDDGRQILVALPTDLPGVECPPAPRLVGVSASCTGEVRCTDVFAANDCLLAGPIENVMQQGKGAGTGGLQTSTLAIGLASAAIEHLEQQAAARPELSSPAASLRAEQQRIEHDLFALAEGQGVCSSEDLRTRANSHVLRSTQAALAAAKGTGYVVGHPAGRWCREALFFLVWSCPQPVIAANLCELASLGD